MKILFLETYLKTIENSLDSKIFQTILAEEEGEKIDIIEKGKKACGLHVSGILKWFNLIEDNHATVVGTINDMKKCGWIMIDKPKKGSVIHWEKWTQGGTPSEHLGFYMGNNKAISNDWQKKTPQEHHWTYNNKRGIEGIYWHPKLDNEYLND